MKIIECYGGNYSVTPEGEIINSKGLILSQKIDSKGKYKMVNLSYQGKKKMFLVHRLVALAFLPKIQDKKYVNHIDGNTQNNKVENLEWVTCSENLKHSINVLGNPKPPTMKGKFGKDHNKSKEFSIQDPEGRIYTFGSALEGQRKLGTNCSIITYLRVNSKPLPHRISKGNLKHWVVLNY